MMTASMVSRKMVVIIKYRYLVHKIVTDLNHKQLAVRRANTPQRWRRRDRRYE